VDLRRGDGRTHGRGDMNERMGVIRARFDERHANFRVLGQAARDDAPAGAGADYQIIENVVLAAHVADLQAWTLAPLSPSPEICRTVVEKRGRSALAACASSAWRRSARAAYPCGFSLLALPRDPAADLLQGPP